MNAQERSELIRKRFKSMFPASVAPRPEPKPKRYVPRRPAFKFVYPMGFAGGPGFVGQWVVTPNDKSKVMPKTKRAAKVSPLTRIAEKWPIKPLLPAPSQSAR